MILFSKYRIKEIKEEGVFIPQVMYCFMWESIDRNGPYTWINEEAQSNYCSFKTLEEARERIKLYKEEIKKPKVKYHRA
jgi:hypothetical protein